MSFDVFVIRVDFTVHLVPAARCDDVAHHVELLHALDPAFIRDQIWIEPEEQ